MIDIYNTGSENVGKNVGENSAKKSKILKKTDSLEEYRKFLKELKNTEIYKRKKDNKELMYIMHLMSQDY